MFAQSVQHLRKKSLSPIFFSVFFFFFFSINTNAAVERFTQYFFTLFTCTASTVHVTH